MHIDIRYKVSLKTPAQGGEIKAPTGGSPDDFITCWGCGQRGASPGNQNAGSTHDKIGVKTSDVFCQSHSRVKIVALAELPGRGIKKGTSAERGMSASEVNRNDR